MEITRLKWGANHPILPNLDIDLKDATGRPYKTIVIAGDNGLGKSTILQSIYYVMMGEPCDLESFEYNIGADSFILTPKDDNHIMIEKNGGKPESVMLEHKLYHERRGHWQDIGNLDDDAPQKYNAILSITSTDFSQTGDKDNDYDTIKKQLITFERQDNEKFRALNRKREEQNQQLLKNTEFDRTESQINKFKNAFNEIFDSLKFDCIKSEVDNTRVIFTKDANEEIDVDNLSTGEKQVVFRGTHILSQAQDADIVLLDEPEIGMHIRWIEKVLPFYQNLLKDPTTNSQRSQLFIATHSDFLIKKAVERNDVLIVRLTKQGNTIVCNKAEDILLPTPTSAEINYVVFGVASVDYHIQLFSQLHNNLIAHNNGKSRIIDVDNSIKGQSQYNPSYRKPYENVHAKGKPTTYESLTCYVRNCIDHPGSPDTKGKVQDYTPAELEKSIKFLRELVEAQNNGTYDYTK